MSDYNAENKKRMENAADTLSDALNIMCRDATPFVDRITYQTHRTLQQSVGGVMFQLINRWADMYEKGQYDLRNESLCKKCHKIRELMNKEDEFWLYLPTV